MNTLDLSTAIKKQTMHTLSPAPCTAPPPLPFLPSVSLFVRGDCCALFSAGLDYSGGQERGWPDGHGKTSFLCPLGLPRSKVLQ
jgi:hypothetical protein